MLPRKGGMHKYRIIQGESGVFYIVDRMTRDSFADRAMLTTELNRAFPE